MEEIAIYAKISNSQLVSDADVEEIVLVINESQNVERGTHDELLEKKGFYYDL